MDYNKILSYVYQAKKFVFSKSKLHDVKTKNPFDYVTAVDTGISDFLKSAFKKEFPDVGFMTEEESEHTLADKCFILDPIDGTTNLIYDYKMSSISLAYAEKGKVVFGVVFNPFTREMFFSVRGRGAHYFKTDKGIKKLLDVGVENFTDNLLFASKRDLEHSIIEFGASTSNKQIADETFTRAKRVFTNCLDLRRICSTALAISYIAAGRLDGYFEKHIKPWDYAAAILLLEEAGGKSSDWDDKPLPLDKAGTIVCSNGTIHSELLDLIK